MNSLPPGFPRYRRRSLRSVLAAPAAIAVISIIGLIAALTGDGVRDFISWVALGIPVITVFRAWTRRG